MKKTAFAIAMLSLILACSTAAAGQSKSKARIKPPNGQICTGCCDPCYSDDGWNIRNQQPNARNAKTTKSTNKSSSTSNARKGKR